MTTTTTLLSEQAAPRTPTHRSSTRDNRWLLLAVVVGIVESVMARLRMDRVPYLLGGASAMAALALILTQAR